MIAYYYFIKLNIFKRLIYILVILGVACFIELKLAGSIDSEMLYPLLLWIFLGLPISILVDEVNKFESDNFVLQYVFIYKCILYSPTIITISIFIESIIIGFMSCMLFVFLNHTIGLESKELVLSNLVTLLTMKTVIVMPLIIFIVFIIFQLVSNKLLKNFLRVIANFTFLFLIMISDKLVLCIMVIVLIFISLFLVQIYKRVMNTRIRTI